MAARNNATWCAAVCASHGIETVFGADAWTSPTRTPPLYPDAVTLAPGVDADRLLAPIDDTPGCTVKDSYAELDLADRGWRVLFDAEWIIRRVTTATVPTTGAAAWMPVGPADVDAWQRAWRGDGQPMDLFRPRLLDDDVVLIARRVGGRTVAGAALNRAAGVVGISNVFGPPGSELDTWRDCIHATGTVFPGSAMVGYESGDARAVALNNGFESIGPLRVWINDG